MTQLDERSPLNLTVLVKSNFYCTGRYRKYFLAAFIKILENTLLK